MILREYQEKALTDITTAVDKFGNTICVAPTGAGKTVIMAATINQYQPAKTLVLQHRAELIEQNRTKYMQWSNKTAGMYTADIKDWSHRTTFAMVETLYRDKNLITIPFMDYLIVDEVHHMPASSYLKILKKVKNENSNIKVIGFTATPERADGLGLRRVFNNVGAVIYLEELVELKFIAKPIATVIDVGTQNELRNVRQTGFIRLTRTSGCEGDRAGV